MPLTLTEFLLERITEREAAANNYLRFEVRGGTPGHYGIRDEVLAECASLRGAVTLAAAYSDGPEHPRTLTLADDILRNLALPYADHPDYRQEWRP